MWALDNIVDVQAVADKPTHFSLHIMSGIRAHEHAHIHCVPSHARAHAVHCAPQPTTTCSSSWTTPLAHSYRTCAHPHAGDDAGGRNRNKSVEPKLSKIRSRTGSRNATPNRQRSRTPHGSPRYTTNKYTPQTDIDPYANTHTHTHTQVAHPARVAGGRERLGPGTPGAGGAGGHC